MQNFKEINESFQKSTDAFRAFGVASLQATAELEALQWKLRLLSMRKGQLKLVSKVNFLISENRFLVK